MIVFIWLVMPLVLCLLSVVMSILEMWQMNWIPATFWMVSAIFFRSLHPKGKS